MNFGRKRPCPFSPKFKQMVDSMLMIDVARRWTMAQVAACEWIAAAPGGAAAPAAPNQMLNREDGMEAQLADLTLCEDASAAADAPSGAPAEVEARQLSEGEAARPASPPPPVRSLSDEEEEEEEERRVVYRSCAGYGDIGEPAGGYEEREVVYRGCCGGGAASPPPLGEGVPLMRHLAARLDFQY
jgi:hypothetical protein